MNASLLYLLTLFTVDETYEEDFIRHLFNKQSNIFPKQLIYSNKKLIKPQEAN